MYSAAGHYTVYSAVFTDNSTEDLRKRMEHELENHYAIRRCVVCTGRFIMHSGITKVSK